MANIYEQQQSDSDDDCEVYFLKPVNEYNIVDKIKEANKELFADSTDIQKKVFNTEAMPEIATGATIDTTEITTKITAMRKVTFAPNLEDYEPEILTQAEIEQSSSEEDSVNDAEKASGNKITNQNRFPTIDEEDQEQTIEEINFNDMKDNENIVKPTTDASESKNILEFNDDDEVDEICEEIIIVETESITTTKQESFSSQHRRAIKKQTTFDCDEQDNRSLMNLLPASDSEEDDDIRAIQVNDKNAERNAFNDSPRDDSIFIGIDDFEDDEGPPIDDPFEEDDDQLSLIVASYLPDDFKRTLTISPMSPSKANYSSSSGVNKKSHSYFRRNNGKIASSCNSPTSPSSSGRRFRLRRNAQSINSIGSSGNLNSCDESNRKSDSLKLSYKTCCEYRNSIQGKLPKYTGYLSEYGLSRRQLQERNQKLQKKQRFVLEQTIQTNEHEMKKMQDNERAFTTWLRNKMRFPINKTRNMFDVKLRFAGKKKSIASSNGSFENSNGKNASET